MLFAVALTDVLSRLLPKKVPAPLLQILAGLLLSLWRPSAHLPLGPEVFFLVFLPPLLFSDAVKLPYESLREDLGKIAGLAIGLVAVTVLGIGLFVHTLLPEVPFAVACALGAVLAPTDAVAVSAFTGSLPFPSRMLTLLRGEALFNDASALLALRLAVGMVLTGQFHSGLALEQLLWLGGGGIALGILLGVALGKFSGWVSDHHYEEPSGQALLSLSIPFLIFILGEKVEVSPFVAVAAAGVTYNRYGLDPNRDPHLRLHSQEVWKTIEFALNGMIFVVLGLELPTRLGAVPHSVDALPGHPILVPLAIVGALVVLRFAWSLALLNLTLFKARRAGHDAPRRPSWRVLIAMTLAGARGTISLAAVLTLPLTTHQGAPFPYREEVLYLATSVVLWTIALAAVGLPLALRGLKLPPETRRQHQEREARAAMQRVAPEAIHQRMAQLVEEGYEEDSVHRFGEALIRSHLFRLEELEPEPGGASRRGRLEIERELRKASLEGQRGLLTRLLADRQITRDLHLKLEHDLDLQQAALRYTSPIHPLTTDH